MSTVYQPGNTFRGAGRKLCHVVAVNQDSNGELVVTWWQWVGGQRRYAATELWVLKLADERLREYAMQRKRR